MCPKLALPQLPAMSSESRHRRLSIFETRLFRLRNGFQMAAMAAFF